MPDIIETGLTPGITFLTEYSLGKGKIVMLGSMPRGEEGISMLQAMIGHYAGEASVQLRWDVCKGTVVAPRKGDNSLIRVIVNMNGEGGSISLPQAGIDDFNG